MFEPTDDLLKYLVKLGLADANGKLLSGALIDPSSTTSGTTQSTEYTLNSITLATALLNSAKRGLLIAAGLTTAANANAKNIKLYVGSTAVLTITGSTASGKDVQLIVLLIRTGANAQRALIALATVDGALVAASSVQATATETESEALAITVKAANTAAAAASATGNGLVVIPLG
jgi:hypothetical protein